MNSCSSPGDEQKRLYCFTFFTQRIFFLPILYLNSDFILHNCDFFCGIATYILITFNFISQPQLYFSQL